MKALLCTHYGTPDDLELADIADPVPGPGEAVVRIEAAALNFFDTLIIAGKYQTKPPMPFSPAAEFAGTVESLGAGVDRSQTRRPGHGLFRLRRRARAHRDRRRQIGQNSRWPRFDRAAGLCVTYGTTLHALKDRAKLKRGETLAVLGASGGVGLAAVELGKIMGARVIACASSAEKIAFARKHGADDGIDYSKEDLKDALRRVTDGRGADVIYDPVGGALCGSGLALDRLAGTFSRGRLCRRRNSKAAAQSRVAQRLRRARRVLGLMDRARPGRPSRQHRTVAGLVRGGKIVVACARGLSARGSAGRAQGHRRTPGDGQGDFAALKICQGVARRLAMHRADVAGDQLDCGRQHGGIVGEADHRQHVGNGVERQNEIGERADQRRLHRQRRLAVEGAVIGREQILGERNLRGDAPYLAPEIAAQRAVVVASRRQNAARANAIAIMWAAKTAAAKGLAHDPEKWEPVFGKDHAQAKC